MNEDICPICKALKKGAETNLSAERYICFGIVLDAMTGNGLANLVCDHHANELALDFMALAGLCFADAAKLDAMGPKRSALPEGQFPSPDDVPTVQDVNLSGIGNKKDMN